LAKANGNEFYTIFKQLLNHSNLSLKKANQTAPVNIHHGSPIPACAKKICGITLIIQICNQKRLTKQRR